MPWKLPSLYETRDVLMAFGRALFPFGNFGSIRSYHGRRATYLAAAVTELHSHIDSVARDLHPLTAGDGAPINGWGGVLGVARKDATPARKSAAGKISGAAGATVTLGTELLHDASGLRYAVNQAVTIPGVAGVDPDSYVNADLVAIDVGARTRLEAGQVLSFVAPPLGIETSVVLQLALDEDGYDAEQFGSYRNRVLATLSEAPSGGNQADFVKWTLAALNTVATAYAYPNRAGRGTIDVVAFYAGTGTSRSLSDTDRAEVAAYLRSKAPFQVAGDGGPLRVLTTIADPQPVEIRLTPNGMAAYAFDWEDSSLPTVSAWEAGGVARQLTFTGALPNTLRAGQRLVLAGGGHDGREYKIESIVSTASPGKVILEKVPATTPAAGHLIYSGGPLVAPVRNAILAHLDGEVVYAGPGLTPLPASAVESTVGLDELAEGIGSANPAGLYGVWSGGIVRATLLKLAMYTAGVRNAVVTTPAADYEATDDAFPNDAQIHYVTPGPVVVRKA